MPQQILDGLSDCVAAACLTAPLWINNAMLAEGHDLFVQWVMPLLGATWLVVQIYYKFKNGK